MSIAGTNVTISVVIPAYNAARFLPRCLSSVFAQTFKPAEVIVVDDGSNDDTAAVAAGLGATVLRRPNGGVSAARNTGIRSAKGEWIALVDADDSWEPTKLERQVELIEDDTVVVYTGIRFWDDKGVVQSENRAIDPTAAMKILRFANPIPCTYIVRREPLMHEGGYREDLRACEDWEMLVRLQRLGKMKAVPDSLVNVYLHSDSLSADPSTMIEPLDRMMDTTLLADLRGLSRWAWRRRIWAHQLCSAGLIARDNGRSGELRYIFQSLCTWPSPFWQPRRLALFAVSARNQLRRAGS